MISFQCTACGKRLKVEDKHAGRKGKCPQCKTRLRVPSETPEEEQAFTETTDPEIASDSPEKQGDPSTAASLERPPEPPVPEESQAGSVSETDPMQQTEAALQEPASTSVTDNQVEESFSKIPEEVQPDQIADDEPEPSLPRQQLLETADTPVPTPRPATTSEMLDHARATSFYTNYTQINMNPEEVILASGFNPQPSGVTNGVIRVRQRLVMSPYTAKRILAALSAVVERHERAFGALEIDVQKRRQVGPAGLEPATKGL